jgi:hypothetical protein
MLEPAAPLSPAEVEDLLRPMAAQLIWWQPPEQALRRPDRVIAQVMELGDFEMVQRLRQGLGDRRLAEVLQRAEAGWFSPRSWTYWHRKLHRHPSAPVPPLPIRRFGA